MENRKGGDKVGGIPAHGLLSVVGVEKDMEEEVPKKRPRQFMIKIKRDQSQPMVNM